MASDRTQRQIDRLLDEAEEAFAQDDWSRSADRARRALLLDPENRDAINFLTAAERALGGSGEALSVTQAPSGPPFAPPQPTPVEPASFANDRYQVQRFLGEGGKKTVYLAHDTLLDRDVAFALIKSDGLDDVSRTRITREDQAMGRLGSHPHVVTVFDMGLHEGQPYMVTELMGGGDVEAVIEKAPEHRLPLERAIDIARSVCQGRSSPTTRASSTGT